MGKSRNKKSWNKVKTRQMKELVLDEHEYMSEQEIQDRKRRIAYVMRIQDNRLTKEQQELERRGVCNNCHMYLTTSGKCPICE